MVVLEQPKTLLDARDTLGYGAMVPVSAQLQIRAFASSDYVALAELYRQAYPDVPKSEAELRYADARFKPPYQHGRWLAERDGVLVGWCNYFQHPSWYQPGTYDIELVVSPGARVQGVGTALYQKLLETLEPRELKQFRVTISDASPAAYSFFERRGFVETQRSWTSTLELDTFSSERFAPQLKEAAERGFEIHSVASLEADDARAFELYTFYQELVADLPRTQPYTPWSFEQFLAHRRNSPLLLPEGSFVVSWTGQLVAVSELKKTAVPARLQTGLTAVRRVFRGQGLALLCKLYALEYAKMHGALQVATRNAASNQAMLRINERLGFVQGTADIELIKSC